MLFIQKPTHPDDGVPIRLRIDRRPVFVIPNRTEKILTDTVTSISHWLSKRISSAFTGMESMSGHATMSVDFGYLDLASTAPELLSELVFEALVEAKKSDLLQMKKNLRPLSVYHLYSVDTKIL